MKSSLRFTRPAGITLGLALGLLLQAGFSTSAKPNPVRPERPNPDRPSVGEPPRGPRPPQGGGPADRLERGPGGGAMDGNLERFLTEEQRLSLREIMLAQRAKAQALQEKVRPARQALLKTALTEEGDETRLRERANAVAQLEVELQLLRLNALREVQPPLSTDQVERMLAAAERLPARQLRPLPDENRAGPRLNRPVPPRDSEAAPRPFRRENR